jgi:hypothetical protein
MGAEQGASLRALEDQNGQMFQIVWETDVSMYIDTSEKVSLAFGVISAERFAEIIRRRFRFDAVAVEITKTARAAENTPATSSERLVTICASAPVRAQLLRRKHEVFDPIAASDAGFQFFVGLSLKLPCGAKGASLVALDRKPRQFAREDLTELRGLGETIASLSWKREVSHKSLLLYMTGERIRHVRPLSFL